MTERGGPLLAFTWNLTLPLCRGKATSSTWVSPRVGRGEGCPSAPAGAASCGQNNRYQTVDEVTESFLTTLRPWDLPDRFEGNLDLWRRIVTILNFV